MEFDLVIKNGTVIDGSGMPRYQADVGIRDGKIVNIGRIRSGAAETLDAEGHIVGPGFVDGHTHMDAQIAWDPLGTCSSWHGVTSVVMGNCGFTLAPCHADNKSMVMKNLERAEDISPAAMEAGIDWNWETFSQYLDTVESLPKGINYAGYIGHSALRTWAMGERALRIRQPRLTSQKWPRNWSQRCVLAPSAFQHRGHLTIKRQMTDPLPQGLQTGRRLSSWSTKWAILMPVFLKSLTNNLAEMKSA